MVLVILTESYDASVCILNSHISRGSCGMVIDCPLGAGNPSIPTHHCWSCCTYIWVATQWCTRLAYTSSFTLITPHKLFYHCQLWLLEMLTTHVHITLPQIAVFCDRQQYFFGIEWCQVLPWIIQSLFGEAPLWNFAPVFCVWVFVLVSSDEVYFGRLGMVHRPKSNLKFPLLSPLFKLLLGFLSKTNLEVTLG